MKILLVNSNPVVSRLTALSARKESVKVDEIKSISEFKKSDYDIAFVDFESYSQELSNLLSSSNISKRVLFYTQDDRETPEIFNITILKPFLPSEVSSILRERKIEIEKNPPEESKEEYVNLNELIADKKDDLAPMNLIDDKLELEEKKEDIKLTPVNLLADEIMEAEKLKIEEKVEENKDEIFLEPINLITDEIIETKKPKIEEEIALEPMNLVKDEIIEDEKAKIEEKIEEKEVVLEPINLIDDKSSEEELLAELSQSKDRIEKIEKSPDLNIAELSREEAKDESKLFELNIVDNQQNNGDDSELFEIDSSKKSISDDDFKDEVLNFDIDSKDEIDFNANSEDKSTKILDGDEISNIKSLLDDNNEKIDEDISLEDVMTTTAPQVYTKVEKKNKKKKKKKAKKSIDSPKLSSEVITDTLQAMPIDDLRRLLLGTKIHITIEFPKEF